MKYRIWTGSMMEPWEHVQAIAPAHFEKEWKVLMFTGLLDRNGREIYEGDITRDIEGGVGVVVFSGRKFSAKDSLGWDNLAHPDECVVIGNVYENAELLRK